MITYRLEKGAPLSILEIDNNFKELEQRLDELDERTSPVQLTVEQQEDVLIIKNGSQTLSHVVLPKFQPVFKGLWAGSTSYGRGHWACYQHSLYACQIPHRSSTEFEPSFWQLIFKGEADA